MIRATSSFGLHGVKAPSAAPPPANKSLQEDDGLSLAEQFLSSWTHDQAPAGGPSLSDMLALQAQRSEVSPDKLADHLATQQIENLVKGNQQVFQTRSRAPVEHEGWLISG